MIEKLNLRFFRGSSLNLVRQEEASECSLACLCMIANYWGCKFDLASLRQRISVSRRGVTVKMLMSAAAIIGLKGRALRLDIEALHDLSTPLILYWTFDHFVVAKKSGRKGLTILDPSLGEQVVKWDTVSKKFTGIAIELTPSDSFAPIFEVKQVSIAHLIGQARGLKRSLTLNLTLSLLLQCLGLIAPLYLKWVLDDVLPAKDVNLLNTLAISFVGVAFVSIITSAARTWISATFAARFSVQWMDRVFVHLLNLPMSFFQKRSTGDIVGKFGSIGTIQSAVTNQLVGSLIDAVLMTVTLAAMLIYSPPLTLIAFFATVLFILGRASTQGMISKGVLDQANASARQSTIFLETLRGMQSIRLYGSADLRRATWLDSLIQQTNAGLKLNRYNILQEINGNIILRISSIFTVWYASGLMMSNTMTIGTLTVFMTYQDQFLSRVTALIGKLFDYRTLKVHRQRLADIVLTEKEEDNDIEFDLKNVDGSFELVNVSYAYSTEEKPVLHNINLVISEGACVAITGPSGGGKTTLLKLLLGLFLPVSGAIRFGGHNLSTVGLRNYRKHIGTVMQDDTLFAGSLSQNIAWFDVEADAERVVCAAQAAAIHDEILAMPMGYDTVIGDMGSGLSGGQKQRVMIARALYRNPKVLIMDEATSHLDIANEAKINASIKQLGITRIIVAHRPDTIAMADYAIRLDKGTLSHQTGTSNTADRQTNEAA